MPGTRADGLIRRKDARMVFSGIHWGFRDPLGAEQQSHPKWKANVHWLCSMAARAGYCPDEVEQLLEGEQPRPITLPNHQSTAKHQDWVRRDPLQSARQ